MLNNKALTNMVDVMWSTQQKVEHQMSRMHPRIKIPWILLLNVFILIFSHIGVHHYIYMCLFSSCYSFHIMEVGQTQKVKPFLTDGGLAYMKLSVWQGKCIISNKNPDSTPIDVTNMTSNGYPSNDAGNGKKRNSCNLFQLYNLQIFVVELFVTSTFCHLTFHVFNILSFNSM